MSARGTVTVHNPSITTFVARKLRTGGGIKTIIVVLTIANWESVTDTMDGSMLSAATI
jgi:hypothetical protein